MHRHGVRRRAGELEGAVGGAAGADGADEMEHQVFGVDAPGELAGEDDLPGGRHAQPGLAEGHGHGDVGRAHACGEGAQGAAGAGMGIGADGDLAGAHVVLGRQDVADATADFGEDGPRPGSELAQEQVVVRELAAGAGRRVVEEDDAAVGAGELLDAELLDLADRQRPRAVLHVGPIDADDDVVVGRDAASGVLAEDLLGHRLAHRPASWWLTRAPSRHRNRRMPAYTALRFSSLTHDSLKNMRPARLSASVRSIASKNLPITCGFFGGMR